MNESSEVFGFFARSEVIALAILVIGAVVARLLSIAVGALLGKVDRRAARITTSESSVMSPRVIRVTKAFVFWLLLVLAVSLSLRVLGVGGISTLLDTVLRFTPRVLVAFLIVVAGHLAGLVAAHLLSQLRDGTSTESPGPRILHGSIVTIAIVMALQHISVDISLITQLLLILVGTVSAGLMLAFALGARQYVANLLARRELARLSIGERIRIGELEGAIVDIHDTGVDIATDDGIAWIPAAQFAEDGVLRKPESEDNA